MRCSSRSSRDELAASSPHIQCTVSDCTVASTGTGTSSVSGARWPTTRVFTPNMEEKPTTMTRNVERAGMWTSLTNRQLVLLHAGLGRAEAAQGIPTAASQTEAHELSGHAPPNHVVLRLPRIRGNQFGGPRGHVVYLKTAATVIAAQSHFNRHGPERIKTSFTILAVVVVSLADASPSLSCCMAASEMLFITHAFGIRTVGGAPWAELSDPTLAGP